MVVAKIIISSAKRRSQSSIQSKKTNDRKAVNLHWKSSKSGSAEEGIQKQRDWNEYESKKKVFNYYLKLKLVIINDQIVCL